jgi:hypothetical protein
MLDNDSSYLFDLSKLHKLSDLGITFHAMRFPVKPFVKMLSSIAQSQSRLSNFELSLFTWRLWISQVPDAERWDAVDVAFVELSQAVRERSGMDLAVQVIVNPLECGPHDVRDVLPRLGEKGLVRLLRGDSNSEPC